MATEQGFAIRRNGSCLAGYEIDCGPTREPFRGCCPTGFECPSQYNIACCPSGNNCTEALRPEPKCANATWDLFDNGGYFCCEHGLPGYNIKNTNGCVSPGFQFGGGEEALATVQAGQSAYTCTAAWAPAVEHSISYEHVLIRQFVDSCRTNCGGSSGRSHRDSDTAHRNMVPPTAETTEETAEPV